MLYLAYFYFFFQLFQGLLSEAPSSLVPYNASFALSLSFTEAVRKILTWALGKHGRSYIPSIHNNVLVVLQFSAAGQPVFCPTSEQVETFEAPMDSSSVAGFYQIHLSLSRKIQFWPTYLIQCSTSGKISKIFTGYGKSHYSSLWPFKARAPVHCAGIQIHTPKRLARSFAIVLFPAPDGLSIAIWMGFHKYLPKLMQMKNNIIYTHSVTCSYCTYLDAEGLSWKTLYAYMILYNEQPDFEASYI